MESVTFKSPFDAINSICSNDKTDHLKDRPDNQKQYVPFIINRSLSYHEDTVLLVNEMNQRPFLDSQMQYDFLRYTIRPKKRFAKWLKPEIEDDIEVVATYYGFTKAKAETVIDIVSKDKIATMREYLNRGGVKKNK